MRFASGQTVRASIGLSLVLVLLGASLSPVSAGVSQDGRNSNAHNVDGSFARLQGHTFNPTAGQCVLYSVLSFDASGTYRQVESGITQCNGVAGGIDGTCPSGHVFVERYNGSGYFCTPGYSFDPIYQYDATTYRTSSTSTTFTGHINGASLSQSGFGLSDNITGYAWGEATGGGVCPSTNSGSFLDWEKYDTSVGWTYVTSSTVYRHWASLVGAPCWTTITSAGSKGDFDVHD